jgi:hypothetical protein
MPSREGVSLAPTAELPGINAGLQNRLDLRCIAGAAGFSPARPRSVGNPWKTQT